MTVEGDSDEQGRQAKAYRTLEPQAKTFRILEALGTDLTLRGR